MKVYVILSQGGWADDETWVSGVYTNRVEAERLMTERVSAGQSYRAWQDHPRQQSTRPKPPYEAVRCAKIVEVELDTWLDEPESYEPEWKDARGEGT